MVTPAAEDLEHAAEEQWVFPLTDPEESSIFDARRGAIRALRNVTVPVNHPALLSEHNAGESPLTPRSSTSRKMRTGMHAQVWRMVDDGIDWLLGSRFHTRSQ
jgi:hypothetical protein